MSVFEIIARLAGSVRTAGAVLVAGAGRLPGAMRLPAATRGDAGASLVEYTLVLMLVALVAFLALQFVGGSAAHSLNNSGSSMFAP
jgi:Flp pilus assembly pilin Flp